MEIFYTSRSEKQLVKIPKRELKKIFVKIEKLCLETSSGKALKGEFEGLFSIRSWPYRIIYKVEKNKLIIFSVAHRQGAYK